MSLRGAQRRSNRYTKGTIFALLITTVLSGCEPVDLPTTVNAPGLVTQIPFFASETPPPLIIPITETPTATPGLPPEITLTPIPVTPSIPSAKWWEVYFTDPLVMNNPDVLTGSIEERLIQLIDQAQTSIHIASFEFNLTPVAQALIAAKNRGVDVKWVADDENGLEYDTQPGRGQFVLMAAAGIELKDDAGRSALMHNKFWIFDGQIVWTGSTNITVNGIFKQNNNVLVIHSPEIAFIFEREFQELWSAQLGPKAPSTVSNQWAILDGTAIQVLF